MNRLIPEKDIIECQKWIDVCLKVGEGFDYKNIYPLDYLNAVAYRELVALDTVKLGIFQDLNNWFGGFTLGIPECDMGDDVIEEILNFVARFCYSKTEYWSESDTIIIVKD